MPFTDLVHSSPRAVRIDHVVIAGKNLNQLRARFEAIGLASINVNIRADGLTHTALITFADGSYLELVAPLPGKTARDNPWSEFMVNNAAVCAWAIRSEDIETDVALFRLRGLKMSQPTTDSYDRADGLHVEWRTAAFAGAPMGTVLPFLIQDITPREHRVPLADPANDLFMGIHSVLLNIDKTRSKLGAAFNVPINRLGRNLMAYIKLPVYVDYIYWNQGKEGLSRFVLNNSPYAGKLDRLKLTEGSKGGL